MGLEPDSGDEAGVDDLDGAEGGDEAEVEDDGAGGEICYLVFREGAGEVYVCWRVAVPVVRLFFLFLLLFALFGFTGCVCSRGCDGAAQDFLVKLFFCTWFVGLVVGER